MENDTIVENVKKTGRPKGVKNENKLMRVPLIQYADTTPELKLKALSLAFDTAHKLGYFKSPHDYDVNRRANESLESYNKRMENANFMKDIREVQALADLNFEYVVR